MLDRWTSDFIRYLGYELTEYPCFDENGNDVTDKMVEAVKKQIDGGKPALVWNAFSVAEYDVVCGYDDEAKHFIGRCALKGNDDYTREPWDRAKTCDACPPFGAVLIGGKVSDFDMKKAEIESLVNAVKHARKESDDEGIKFYREWAEEYSREGKERGAADAYCYDVYSSVRKAAVAYLHSLANNYDGTVSDCFHYAAASFEKEANELAKAKPYVSWDSPWGIDEQRSKNVAPILKAAAEHYEKGIEYLEKILKLLNIKILEENNMGFNGSVEDFKSSENEFSAKKFTGEAWFDFEKTKDTASIKIMSKCGKGDFSLSIKLANRVELIEIGEYTIDLGDWSDGKYTITAAAKNAEDVLVKYKFV